MRETTLKPCPFCGGKPSIEEGLVFCESDTCYEIQGIPEHLWNARAGSGEHSDQGGVERGPSSQFTRKEGDGTPNVLDLIRAKPVVDANVETVKAKMDARAKVGLSKYGVTTERDDFSLIDWLRHLQEEQMDAAIYIEAAIKSLDSASPSSTDEAAQN